MSQSLVLTREELLRDHHYARPHLEAGYRLHGGFLASGEYVSPRTLTRIPAVERWAEALVAQGGELIDVSGGILPDPIWPNFDQAKLLLKHGLGRIFWNQLTLTALGEVRGGVLRYAEAPDFQSIIADDISVTVTGHLNKGLLWAHGADEAGDPSLPEVGAHDFLWYAVRDLVFDKDAYPSPELGNIARTVSPKEMPIPPGHETIIKLLMNALVVEVRAEGLFDHASRLLGDPELFVDRRDAALHAVKLIDRIRLDESIHVRYLQVFVSELRRFRFLCEDGSIQVGAAFIDPVWDRSRRYVERADRQATYRQIEEDARDILGIPSATAMLREFDALASNASDLRDQAATALPRSTTCGTSQRRL